jgi:hypothetical protein
LHVGDRAAQLERIERSDVMEDDEIYRMLSTVEKWVDASSHILVSKEEVRKALTGIRAKNIATQVIHETELALAYDERDALVEEVKRLQDLIVGWYHGDDEEGAINVALGGDPVDALTEEARKIEAEHEQS